MKKFREKKKRKEGFSDYVIDPILEFILEGILSLLWRLVVGFFQLLIRVIGGIFHHL